MFEEDTPVSSVGYFLRHEMVSIGSVVTRYRHPRFGFGWLHFSKPVQTYETDRIDGVVDVLAHAESAVEQGHWATGFLTYEACAAFDRAIRMLSPSFPLLAHFAVYEGPPAFYKELWPVYESPEVKIEESELEAVDYGHRFDRVKELLAEGTTYQVNLTFRLRFSTDSDPFSLFVSRCGTQPAPYATFVALDRWSVASFSPELLLGRSGSELRMQPMKGTRPAGMDRELSASEKDMAENLMIVDMVRHDLGSFADTGSVSVPQLFAVESHRTVQQMTSTVSARSDRPTAEVLAKILPAASITGAPKISAANEIAKLERSPRNLYCGSIGFMGPERRARFSVAIRTAVLDSRGRGEYGVGSGIVWDSRPEEEFRECLLKAQVLHEPAPQWRLLESIGIDALEDQALLEGHLSRLASSSQELEFDVTGLRNTVIETIRSGLPDPLIGGWESIRKSTGLDRPVGSRWSVLQVPKALPPTPLSSPEGSRLGPLAGIRRQVEGDFPEYLHRPLGREPRPKLRLTIGTNLKIAVEPGLSKFGLATPRTALALEPAPSAAMDYRHKTTSRAMYEAFLDSRTNFDDVLLFNEARNVTEFCNGNVAVMRDGVLVTPPLDDGCLGGVMRNLLVERGEIQVGHVSVEECLTGRVFLCNAVVGVVEVRLEG